MLVWAVKVFRRIFTINFHLGLLLGYLFYVFIFIQSSINESVDEEPTTFLNPRILRGINTKTVSNISGQVHILNQSTENLGNQDPLKDKIRVVCWVLTHPSEHRRRASHIKRTWGKRCNTLLFMSTKEDRLGAVVLDVVESVWNLRRKIQEAWRYVHKNHLNDGDWFIAVEDDSYVIMENLRQFLFPFDHLSPLSFGHLMQSEEDPYVARRPGYVLSHEAVVRLIEKGFNNEQAIADCGAISWGYDEVAMDVSLPAKLKSIKDTESLKDGLRVWLT